MLSLVAVLFCLSTFVVAQPTTLLVHVTADGRPIQGASVNVGGTPYTTNAEGVVTAPVTPVPDA